MHSQCSLRLLPAIELVKFGQFKQDVAVKIQLYVFLLQGIQIEGVKL